VVGWENAPPEVRDQVRRVTEGTGDILGGDVVGVYLHGSLALGCFNAARSDIDVLAVTRRKLTDDDKLAFVDLFLHASLDPYGIEADVVTTEQLRTWRHPTPFELHYWESRREEFAFDPLGTLASIGIENADLAAHVTVTRAAGIPLVGPPPEAVFPRVPDADLRDSLLRDLQWSRDVRSALYGVLSPCRIWATLETGGIHSKATGAAWALERLPHELKPLVERALASYTGTGEPIDADEQERRRLLDYVDERVRR
jgi:streptomycin 3"-adenylyltransferase